MFFLMQWVVLDIFSVWKIVIYGSLYAFLTIAALFLFLKNDINYFKNLIKRK